MKVSVVIPAKNAQDILPACLKALQRQEGLQPGEDFEVILVDDGSTDDTARVGRECGAKVIFQPNAGPASARNTGVRSAEGEIVAFTDADCVPAEDWLRQIIAPFSDPRVVGVKGVYRTREKGLMPRFVQLEYESKYERMRRKETIDFIDTNSAAYRRRVFLENGGFDEIFPVPSVEDAEFSFRLARKGYRMVFCPQAAVYHRHDLTVMEYAHRKYVIGYWKAVMMNWLPEKTLSDSHAPASQRYQIALIALMVGSLLLAVGWAPFAWLALAALALFVLSTLPFLAFLAQRDLPVFGVALPLLFLRALTMGAGLFWGVFHIGKMRSHRKGLNLAERVIKRAVDALGAGLGLALTSPFLLAGLVAAWMDGAGPAVVSCRLAGENGKVFRKYALRPPTRSENTILRWRIDRLPEFWNVLRGDMSLTGPRPQPAEVVERYNDRYRQLLLVKPGMTGPAQAFGVTAEGQASCLEEELSFIENYSLGKDVQVLLRTAWLALRPATSPVDKSSI